MSFSCSRSSGKECRGILLAELKTGDPAFDSQLTPAHKKRVSGKKEVERLAPTSSVKPKKKKKRSRRAPKVSDEHADLKMGVAAVHDHEDVAVEAVGSSKKARAVSDPLEVQKQVVAAMESVLANHRGETNITKIEFHLHFGQ